MPKLAAELPSADDNEFCMLEAKLCDNPLDIELWSELPRVWDRLSESEDESDCEKLLAIDWAMLPDSELPRVCDRLSESEDERDCAKEVDNCVDSC